MLKGTLGLLVVLVISACASTSNIEVRDGASVENLSISSVNVSNETGETFEDINVEQMMIEAVEKEIQSTGIGADSDAFSLNISIIQYKKGSAAARWLMPGLGKTILSVEAQLIDSDGNVAASLQATETVGAGGFYTVGAWKRVFDRIAESLVDDLV